MKAPALLLTIAAACGGSGSSATPPAPVKTPASAPATSTPATVAPSSGAAAVASARARLADPVQSVRDAAAEELRALLAQQPQLAGASEATWQQRLAAIAPGTPAIDLAAALSAMEEGAMPNGQGPSLRLDDAWTVQAYVTGAGVQRTPVPVPSLIKFGPLQSSSRSVPVAPPQNYTGRWVTYFANGVVNNDFNYLNGGYVRVTVHYDNGQEAYTQLYVNGVADGPDLGFHRDGSKAYAIERAGGISVGTWTHWYPNGKKHTEETYVAGKLNGVSTGWREDGSKDYEMHYAAGVETGQASWDEHGKLLYAHGSAKTP